MSVKTSSNGVAKTPAIEINKKENSNTKPMEKQTAITHKHTKMTELEGFGNQSLKQISVYKNLSDFRKKIEDLHNFLKESESTVRVVILANDQDMLHVSKPDVIEELLNLLDQKNQNFMDKLADEIIK